MGEQRFRKETIEVNLPHPLYKKSDVLCKITAWLIEREGVRLAVHRGMRSTIDMDDKVIAIQADVPEYEKHKAWAITHANTGRLIGLYAPSELKARQMAEAVLHDPILSKVMNASDEGMILRRARLSGLDKVKTRMDVIRKTVMSGRAHELPGMASEGEE